MKILFICHALTGGGAERVCVSWANGLARRGHDISILTDISQPCTYETESTIRIIPFSQRNVKSNRLFRIIDRSWKMYIQFYKVLKENRYDVVVSVLYCSAISLRLASWMVKIPVLITDHNAYDRPKHSPMGWKQWMDKFVICRLFDGVTVLTEADAEICKNARIKNVEVLHNPLFLKPQVDRTVKQKVVLSVGRINNWHYKGFDVLIKAWNKVYSLHKDWKLKIVGGGSEEDFKFLISLAKDPNSLILQPYTKNIVEVYKNAAIYCLSSRYEGWGLVLPEAMSQRCATIATNYKGRQSEIITDGIDGILCPPDDIDALAERIERLISDKEFRESLQENAIINLSRFSEEMVAQNLENLLISKVIGKSFRRKKQSS